VPESARISATLSVAVSAWKRWNEDERPFRSLRLRA
jgi:hypothetical protein